jgi:hypothetical protein
LNFISRLTPIFDRSTAHRITSCDSAGDPLADQRGLSAATRPTHSLRSGSLRALRVTAVRPKRAAALRPTELRTTTAADLRTGAPA